ncbi:Fic family protein [Mycobacterium talmoniae]|uniref:Adenosine monophosphate-protein transferase SoFic n=1 Tax=Mycobacterium talmoniae TaxID=1858794 RepID=A0A1S1NMA6_9MYCO|nr:MULTISPECIES: Fic family protein [Mycobacterium]OHV05118.1 cell filamentation protein Fic [Mycobacterium talmoniae]PQM45615.1 Adenosine monophosphate-protein transferase SoFic [Mycobacterium talmoniae]TDH49130.1 Fic family protein [Mycobacterium eburneum]
MAEHRELYWEPTQGRGLVARDRRGGRYPAYVPDTLCTRPIHIPAELSISAASVERQIHGLAVGPRAKSLEGISRFLLRSEAIASSMIEGIAPSPQQVAIAELAQEERIRGFSAQAGLVANNITVLRRAALELVQAPEVTVGDIIELHSSLLPDEQHHGLRTVQNWIGGSNWNPLDADFVPPPADAVPDLMDDFVTYLNGSSHGPLIQAGLVHAQFETIHPFTDGNGRVGRALIHTVLARRGLAPRAILPVSLVLATLRDSYIGGLTAFRYIGGPLSDPAVSGVATWLSRFVHAARIAVEQAERLAGEVDLLREEWNRRLADWRAEQRMRPEPRSGSATARLLGMLPEAPMLTARTVQRLLDVSFPRARDALEELAEAGVLSRKSVDRGTTGYVAREVLDLVGLAERRLASTRFDTRVSKPIRSVPALPEQ